MSQSPKKCFVLYPLQSHYIQNEHSKLSDCHKPLCHKGLRRYFRVGHLRNTPTSRHISYLSYTTQTNPPKSGIFYGSCIAATSCDRLLTPLAGGILRKHYSHDKSRQLLSSCRGYGIWTPLTLLMELTYTTPLTSSGYTTPPTLLQRYYRIPHHPKGKNPLNPSLGESSYTTPPTAR